jgi:hypothetical protein
MRSGDGGQPDGGLTFVRSKKSRRQGGFLLDAAEQSRSQATTIDLHLKIRTRMMMTSKVPMPIYMFFSLTIANALSEHVAYMAICTLSHIAG